MMRQCFRVALPCAALVVAVVGAHGQQPETATYRTAQYLKVPADKEGAYLDFLRKNSSSIYRVRMQAGDVLSWMVLKLAYEGSPAIEYNYVATALHKGPPVDLSMEEQDQLFRRATGMSYVEYQQKLMDLRTNIGTMLGITDATVPGTQVREGNYVALSRWKLEPLQGEAYSDYVQTMLLPLHIQNFKDGHHLGWSASRLLYPGGSEAPFDVTIATIYKDLASAVAVRSQAEMAARFSKAHPDKSYVAFVDRGRAIRRIVRTELYKVMIAEDASQQTSSMPDQRPTGAVPGRP